MSFPDLTSWFQSTSKHCYNFYIMQHEALTRKCLGRPDTAKTDSSLEELHQDMNQEHTAPETLMLFKRLRVHDSSKCMWSDDALTKCFATMPSLFLAGPIISNYQPVFSICRLPTESFCNLRN